MMLLRSILLQLLLCFLINAQSYESDYSASDDDDGKYTEGDQTDYSKFFNAPYSEPLEENSENGFVKPLEFSSFFSSPQFGGAEETLVVPSPIKQDQEGFVPDEFNQGFAPGGSIDYFEQAQKETKSDEQVDIPGYVPNKTPRYGGYQEEISNFRQKSTPYNSQAKEKQVEETNFKPSPIDTAQYLNQDLYKKYTQTPYQQISVQPQVNSYGLGSYNPSYLKTASSADLNYEYLPTQIVPQNLKQGECVKVNKKVDNKMTCYVCRSPKTGVKSEHCSYEQEPKAYYRSMTKTYNRPDAYRIKRDSEKEEYEDPYEQIKANTHKYFSQPEEFRKKFYSAPDFSDFEEYKYEPLKDDEKSYSETQAEEVAQNKENCKEVKREKGVTCVACDDPKTGGSFEKCEYQSQPEEQKYAYVKERKYDGEPEEEKEEESKAQEYTEKESEEEIPKHFVEVTKKHKQAGVRGLDPKLYGGSNVKLKKHKDLTVFPKETRTIPQYFDASDKKDVEKVLEEFTKKDRSDCKQIKKKGMTCYLCVDKKGIKNEECMYVSESQPQSSLIAYHQLERTKDLPEKLAESKIQTSKSKPNDTFKASAMEDSVVAASNRKEAKQRRKVKEESEPVPQFDVNDESGLYTSETRPVFVKSLGMTLPKYMVEKTEFEKEFDQTVHNDRN
ncbi:hypothetical protein FQR65_LT01912 [Abscondita terminalis]|nr:hypothetical protein FQR65_LT01912 [Abscondita terminalis]